MENVDNKLDEPSPEYLKGFNEGYLLRKEMPELTASLVKSLPDNDERCVGFKAGSWQYELMMGKTTYPSWMKEQFEKDDLGPDKEIDKDDYEPER